jgi:DNA-binding HxlR family transcriptional regulator
VRAADSGEGQKKAPEAISTNILADRPKLLECVCVIERFDDRSGSAHSRYRLTRKGADLLPVLQTLAWWGSHHIPDRWDPPPWFLKAKPKDFYPK